MLQNHIREGYRRAVPRAYAGLLPAMLCRKHVVEDCCKPLQRAVQITLQQVALPGFVQACLEVRQWRQYNDIRGWPSFRRGGRGRGGLWARGKLPEREIVCRAYTQLA